MWEALERKKKQEEVSQERMIPILSNPHEEFGSHT
jgi:hypothetical protein